MKKETLSISEKEVPKHRNALEEKYQNTQEKEFKKNFEMVKLESSSWTIDVPLRKTK